MIKHWVIVLLMIVPFGLSAQELERKVYFFHPKYLKSSIRHEISSSMGLHIGKISDASYVF